MTLIKRNENFTAVEPIGGRRVWFATKTPNRRLAEKRAKAYFDAIRAENVKAANLLTNRIGGSVPTFKELFEYYEDQSPCRPATVAEYINCLKLIIRETLGKYDEDAPVSLDGKIVSDFEKLRRDKAKGKSIKAQHSAKRNAFSLVRKAKAIFTKAMQKRYLDGGMHIDVKEFLERPIANGPSVRYKAPKDKGLAARTFKASEQLRKDDPNAFIAFTLATQAGLRKSEIANAKVSWIEDHLIHIQPEGEFDTKNSLDREVPINAATYSTLIEFVAGVTEEPKGADDYILDGNPTERKENTFRRLNKWLAGLGWTHSDKRTHELRKWYGSQVAKLGGIHAAQHLLGHMDYSTTDRYYADYVGEKIVVGQ